MVDPHAENYYNWSPYAYVGNNPLRFTDPTGEEPEDGIWDALKKALKQTVNEILTAAGLSQGQIQSDDPAVLEDASQKRIAAAENIDAVNEVLLTPVPGGTVINKVATGRGNDVTLGEGAMAVAEIAPVGKILKVGKVTVKGVEKAIVIGEGMGRVKTAAESVDAKWYQAWSKNFPKAGALMTESQMNAAKARNARWINTKIKEGYTIYDIGIDANRANRSPFYQLEKDIIKKNNYPVIKLP